MPTGVSMITGYNTDVPHSDVIFHVQTEDKGADSAWIESLVYVGGQVVARKRSSYKDCLDEGKGRDAIVKLMDRQHRLMIAEIRSGKYDPQVPQIVGGVIVEERTSPEQPTETPEAASPSTATAEHKTLDELVLAEGKAGAAEGDSTHESTPTLDQVILEYLNSEAELEHLVLMMEAAGELIFGEEVVLRIRTKSSVSDAAVPRTLVAVKMISTVSSPTTIAAGETDEKGELTLSVRIPALQRGTGALIITATSKLGTAEIKHLL